MKTQKLLVAACVLLFASCQKNDFNSKPANTSEASLKELISENGNNPDETMLTNRTAQSDEGYVYIQSNDPEHNAVLNYAQNHETGALTLEQTVMTGGKGAGAPLGSQGSVVLSADHKWLLAVNAGSNSISTFRVDAEGDITFSHMRGSEGTFPVSVCIHNDLVYVVNSVTADIQGFQLGSDGGLNYITGSHQKLSVPNAVPGQIAISPNGLTVIVTERFSNTISTYPIDPTTGAAGPGFFTPSVGQEPFGFDFSGGKYMIVSNAAFAAPFGASCTSYDNFLHPSALNGAVRNYQTAACWVSTTQYGRFAFVTNTKSNTINSYYIAANGNIYFLSWSVINSPLAPIDLRVSGDNSFVYCINSGTHTLGKFERGFNGTLKDIGTVANIPPFAAGMAAY